MPLTLPTNDHGLIRVFRVTDPAPAGLAEKTPAALQALFGTDALDVTYVDVVDTRHLAGLSLLDYLHQGYDVPSDAADDAALRDLTGVVVLIMSRAAAGQALTLTLAPQVTHVTTTGDPVQLRTPGQKLPSSSATGRVTGSKAPPFAAAMSGRVATIALLVLFALVGVMIWVAS